MTPTSPLYPAREWQGKEWFPTQMLKTSLVGISLLTQPLCKQASLLIWLDLWAGHCSLSSILGGTPQCADDCSLFWGSGFINITIVHVSRQDFFLQGVTATAEWSLHQLPHFQGNETWGSCDQRGNPFLMATISARRYQIVCCLSRYYTHAILRVSYTMLSKKSLLLFF